MITINILAVGNLKEKFSKDMQEEYLKRISRFAKINIIEIEERNKESNDEITLSKEGKVILSKIEGYPILLDIKGKEYSSIEFADKIDKLSLKTAKITFIIGSSCGVSQEVKDNIADKMSFGKATFPHNLARIMLEEQIYRAFTILNHIKYNK